MGEGFLDCTNIMAVFLLHFAKQAFMTDMNNDSDDGFSLLFLRGK